MTLSRLSAQVMPRARQQSGKKVIKGMGEAAMIDAAAVIAAFNCYPRVADATGIPLEEAKAAATATMRAELGLDELDVRKVTGSE